MLLLTLKTQCNSLSFCTKVTHKHVGAAVVGTKRPGHILQMCQLFSVSAQKRQSRHDGEAHQDEEHLQKLLPGGVELMREDL